MNLDDDDFFVALSKDDCPTDCPSSDQDLMLSITDSVGGCDGEYLFEWNGVDRWVYNGSIGSCVTPDIICAGGNYSLTIADIIITIEPINDECDSCTTVAFESDCGCDFIDSTFCIRAIDTGGGTELECCPGVLIPDILSFHVSFSTCDCQPDPVTGELILGTGSWDGTFLFCGSSQCSMNFYCEGVEFHLDLITDCGGFTTGSANFIDCEGLQFTFALDAFSTLVPCGCGDPPTTINITISS